MGLEKLVDELYADMDVQRMLSLAATAAPLRICYPREVNVSRFLAWLMDPSEGHGLGDHALRSLLARAGQSDRAEHLSHNDRRFLSSSNIYTQSFSSVVVSTEVDVGLNAKKMLDILILDPSARLYVAIENKFGSKEGVDQTKGYRKGLKKLFPGYRGIHIYLDSNEAEPSDGAWLAVGYDWLAEFLKSSEQRESMARHVRETLAQFRVIVEEEDEDSAAQSTLGTLISHVTGKHRDVLDEMKALVKPAARSQRAKGLAAIVKEGLATKQAKAKMRLFQLYCTRPTLWEQCFKQTLFGPFRSALREKFSGLSVDPRRVVTTFSLDDWQRLVDKEGKDAWYYIAGVKVRCSSDKYSVVCYLDFSDVKPEKREPLLAFANQMRTQSGIRVGSENYGWLALKRVENLSSKQAIDESVEQLLALKQGLDRIR
ncbi:TPA: PD-(D/E)XK nuclease family protein [Stenotrophomonas maltophilia]|nr:PD-(D/E)XK nuclease family protein [Stenotrophomonas maltophilia]HDS1041932.1 PD-(D/E)XK nuclease family protein [Stenotrophomonas maltophilia]